jgi:hypothetical protein
MEKLLLPNTVGGTVAEKVNERWMKRMNTIKYCIVYS